VTRPDRIEEIVLADHSIDERMEEDVMLKHLSICSALMAFTMGSATARQREAMLQRISVPGTGFDIVLAKPKPGGRDLQPR
jgi:hypothetical protein